MLVQAFKVLRGLQVLQAKRDHKENKENRVFRVKLDQQGQPGLLDQPVVLVVALQKDIRLEFCNLILRGDRLEFGLASSQNKEVEWRNGMKKAIRVDRW
jgi:hypothetical protein